MKRILFVGLIALLVLLAVPMAMAETPTEQTVAVYGTSTPSFAVDVGESIAFDSFEIGTHTTADFPVTVTTNNPVWVVTESADQGGYMKAAGPLTLGTIFKGYAGYPDLTPDFYNLDSSKVFWHGTTGQPTPDSKLCAFQQTVTNLDTPGAYSITVTFAIGPV